MLNIDLSNKKAFIVGIGDDQGFGFAIAKALAEANCEILIGTWAPILNIFKKSWELKKFDDSRVLKDGSLWNYSKVYPIDAMYDTKDDIPEDIKNNKRYKDLEGKVGTDLPELKDRKLKTMQQLNFNQAELEKLTNASRNSITHIIANCKNEQNYIKRWTISGKEVNLVMPIMKIYIPLYFAELEDEDGEEKFIISPPIIIPRDYSLETRWVPFEFISSSFSPLIKDRLETVLENNFELRSKFEFSCDNKNLFQFEEMDKRILRGFNMLIRDKLMDEQHVNEIKKNWTKFRDKLKK